MIALLAAVGGTGATIYDYHKALQFLGVLGLLVTAVFRYNSFKVRLPFPLTVWRASLFGASVAGGP